MSSVFFQFTLGFTPRPRPPAPIPLESPATIPLESPATIALEAHPPQPRVIFFPQSPISHTAAATILCSRASRLPLDRRRAPAPLLPRAPPPPPTPLFPELLLFLSRQTSTRLLQRCSQCRRPQRRSPRGQVGGRVFWPPSRRGCADAAQQQGAGPERTARRT